MDMLVLDTFLASQDQACCGTVEVFMKDAKNDVRSFQSTNNEFRTSLELT